MMSNEYLFGVYCPKCQKEAPDGVNLDEWCRPTVKMCMKPAVVLIGCAIHPGEDFIPVFIDVVKQSKAIGIQFGEGYAEELIREQGKQTW